MGPPLLLRAFTSRGQDSLARVLANEDRAPGRCKRTCCCLSVDWLLWSLGLFHGGHVPDVDPECLIHSKGSVL